MTQRAVFGVSVFDFRGVTSLVIFQNSTPKFEAMSIEKPKFTLSSRYILASVFRKPFCEALFFVYCPANFEVALPAPWVSKRPGLLPAPA